MSAVSIDSQPSFVHATDAVTSLPATTPVERQGALRRGLFRFGFCYWILFCIPIIGVPIPGVENPAVLARWWGALMVWVGRNVFGITREIPLEQTGSGDTTSDWLSLFSFAVIALLLALVWSLADRRSISHPRAKELLRVLLRYALAFTMLGYGVIKLFRGQFPEPGVGRLLERYGDSSPMGLLWAFMGYSGPYIIFTGAAETLGACLLFFRRTTALGALVLSVVLTNVVMLNFCYDVPVKINSTHYLIMAIVLLLPDLQRLADLLIFHRPTVPRRQALELPRRWMRIARVLAKYGLIASTLVMNVVGARESSASMAPQTWYDGYWDVEQMTRNGADVPALMTDTTRWKRIKTESFQGKSWLRWHNLDGSMGPLYTLVVDDDKHTMTLTAAEPKAPDVSPLLITRPDAAHLRLSGRIGKDAVTVSLQRFEPGKMLLLSRGFHWVNEVPFNR